jgi:hypothetical protein
MKCLSLFLFLFALSFPAQAYIGLGVGIPLLEPVFMMLFAVFVSVILALLWPLRYLHSLLKRWRKRREDNTDI